MRNIDEKNNNISLDIQLANIKAKRAKSFGDINDTFCGNVKNLSEKHPAFQIKKQRQNQKSNISQRLNMLRYDTHTNKLKLNN